MVFCYGCPCRLIEKGCLILTSCLLLKPSVNGIGFSFWALKTLPLNQLSVPEILKNLVWNSRVEWKWTLWFAVVTFLPQGLRRSYPLLPEVEGEITGQMGSKGGGVVDIIILICYSSYFLSFPILSNFTRIWLYLFGHPFICSLFVAYRLIRIF